jgi:outer membrane protein OmpA-like peptidoglycan-associated protein
MSYNKMIRKIGLAVLAMLVVGCASSHQGAILLSEQVPHHPEVKIERLPSEINSTEDDFGIVQAGGKTYITSDRSSGKGRQDLFYANAELGSITHNSHVQVQSLAELNTPENEGTMTFTPDGLTMIFAAGNRDDAAGSSDLYQADLIHGIWSNVRNLTALNTEHWESQPSLASDGKTLYFVSDRDGGFGGQDIYVSTRVGDNWTAPQNLGPVINTQGNEATPFIAADGRTLYYSSNGRPGLGGYDVYVTHNVGGLWDAPINAGTPINTIHDDLFYSVQLGTQHAFVSSDRDSTMGELDIFAVEPNPFAPGGVTVVEGNVTNAATHRPIAAAITITDLSSNEVISRFRSDDVSGHYLVVLQPGKTYSITGEAPGFLFYSDDYSVVESKDKHLTHDIALSPVSSGRTRLLIFFDFNSAALKHESLPELDRAVGLMKSEPTMRVTIAGFTDSVGSAAFNQRLSEERAQSVVGYLTSHGIAANRLLAVGFGETNPVADNGTEEGRARNRHVEFQVH